MPEANRQRVEFLCVTMYTDDTSPLRSFYHDALGLPIDFEVAGHITAMPNVCRHDPSEAAAGTLRLYFLCDDVPALANGAGECGVTGLLRQDGSGNPAWETTDPFGNSVVVLTRTKE